ncbi:MAG TPA: hypothetical protein VMY34_06005 [Acidimicrobiales bacterium]|nr:hypothetical protein [Acidimicrobiales bacterium]
MTRVGVLECDHVRPDLLSIAGDYVDMFRALLPSCDIVGYDVRAGALPAAPDECDGWICTGSQRSVYDSDGWIDAMSGFVRDVRDRRVPFVGICFGHQLIAHALGGRVERAESGWGVGTLQASVTRSAAWMVPGQDSYALLYSHQDQVVAMPMGGRVLASADHAPVAMLVVGDTMLGIQGHPEFGAPYLEALLADRIDRIGAERLNEALESLAESRDDALVARWIANFLGVS